MTEVDEDFSVSEDEYEDALIEAINPFSNDENKKKRKSRRESNKKNEIDQKNAADWWKAVLSTDVGRREIWNILQLAGTFEDNFGCSPSGYPDQQATWFYAGKKSFGLGLYHKMMAMEMQSIFFMHKENDPRFVK